MKKFVTQGRFEDRTLAKFGQWLQPNSLTPGCGGNPAGLARGIAIAVERGENLEAGAK